MSYHHLGSQRVIARKQHRCVWCDQPILAGSRYDRQSGIIDGDFQSAAWHEACLTGFDQYFAETRENEFIPGEQEMPFHSLYQLEVSSHDQ